MTATAAGLQLRNPAPEDVKTADDTDQRFWSVTTLIGVIDKPALIAWAANETARAAVDNLDSWRAIQASDGDPEAMKWLAGARFRAGKGRLTAADLGSTVHACAEDYALEGRRPDPDAIAAHAAATGSGKKLSKADLAAEVAVVDTMLERFSEFLDRFQPDYQATEVTVYHPAFGYAGTCDGFFTVDGTRLIFDIKTTREPRDGQGRTKGPYPEVALQLAAYRHAQFAAVWRPRRTTEFRRRYYLLGPAERAQAHPLPEVDHGAVIHITPEHCELFPVRCDEAVFERFLHVVEVARWRFEMESHVIGAPLEAPDTNGEATS